MTINAEKQTIECSPDKTMMNILRELGWLSVKSGCEEGICGSCTVLMDGVPVPSCCVPAALARNSEIITLEYFQKTAEYRAIMAGFRKAGISLCGYCNAAKVFTAYQVICTKRSLTRQDIATMIQGIAPCCTDQDTLINGMIYSIKEYITPGKD